MQLGQKAQEVQAGGQLERELAKLDADVTMQAARLDTDRDTQFVLSQERRDQTAYQGKMEELRIKREIAVLEYSSKHQMTLEQTEAQLAAVAMSETTKRQIAQAQIQLNQAENHKDRVVDVHKHGVDKQTEVRKQQISADQSVLEPPGRAKPGHAFSQ
jgi:hypothetical protein